jgi:hypothetical protein
MRLLNTTTLQLETFRSKIPEYAILSHTWGKSWDEVSFPDITEYKLKDQMREKPGFRKVKYLCDQAKEDGFEYAWIDTCCIDKSDPAELSLSLNSMFTWYRESAVCYTYLTDVPSDDKPELKDSKFAKSKWFTRGWTLQELIAPQYLVFYSEDWKEIGTKASLRGTISQITGIDERVLVVRYNGQVSVAQRMCWAAKRETSRIEDRAYSLLGIFGVHMIANYGEGENAFRRLQLEIMSSSNDHSIFAWKASGKDSTKESGLLASSPADFANSDDIQQFNYNMTPSPYFMTNRGLRIDLPLVPVEAHNNRFQALLNCRRPRDNTPLGIYVEKRENDEFVRVQPAELFVSDKALAPPATRIFVKQKDPSMFALAEWMRRKGAYKIEVKSPSWNQHGIELVERDPQEGWSQKDGKEVLSMWYSGHSGILLFKESNGEKFGVTLGVHNWTPWCHIATGLKDETAAEVRASYYDDKGDATKSRYRILWRCDDRSVGYVSEGREVSVAIKPGPQSVDEGRNSGKLHTTIQIQPNQSPPQSAPAKPAQYRFSVRLAPQVQLQGYQIHEVYPPPEDTDNWWTPLHVDPAILSLDHSGQHAVMILQNKDDNKLIAVILGVFNYKRWCDIMFVENETAKEIFDSYYSKGALKWHVGPEKSLSLSNGSVMRVTTHEKDNGAFPALISM